ncbi:putative mitochondrion protein [Naematelia encephala]|uniref:Putative mitochondrion protein n=1 Tax=Naematelia encephala TaxID=71784 RepID=A0A1Y2B3I5_9TREE|nr:putative mitochondrion protein [Naematelia encephala]
MLNSARSQVRQYAASASASAPKRQRRWVRRSVVSVGLVGGLYLADRELNASALTRSLRTGWIGLICTIDYKINFIPSKADKIDALHERVASRLKWVIDTNQGLYLKLGQALGLQAALLPKPYREAFGHVFDRAPSVDYTEVQGVFRKDLGVDPEEIFETFSHSPLASASIAQVHKATLKDGSVVAVKVQKPAIEKQMELDLFSYRSLMWLCEKLFDMPMYFVAKYVSTQMRYETSFLNEASNARRCAELLAQTPELRDDVYVPRVFGAPEGCKESDRIMIMEWVDGCRLNDRQAIEGMGLNLKEVMDIAISTMSAMTFSWGFVHCDPHPGNILVRKHPTKKGKPQIIIIDHGLYISLPTQFREEYCNLWRSLFVLDVPQIERIALKWGIALDANMFASAILLRPFQVDKYKRKQKNKNDPEPEKSQYEQQVELKQRLKTILENEQLIPRELIFLARCQRMMQANNQMLGSPSSRVNLTAKWAAKGYASSITSPRTIHRVGMSRWLRDRLDNFIFNVTLAVIDVAFLFTRLKQWLVPARQGWEDKLQKQFESMAKEEFGIEIDDRAFLG